MNGRAYDYNLGRFLSVDPIIQFPANSQSLNPYSYLMNNPMSGTDPTGYACTGSRINDCDATGAAVLQFAGRPNDQRKAPVSNGALPQDDPQNIGKDLTATEKLVAQDKNLGVPGAPSMMEETVTIGSAIAVRGGTSTVFPARYLLWELGKLAGREAAFFGATILTFPIAVGAVGALIPSSTGGCTVDGCMSDVPEFSPLYPGAVAEGIRGPSVMQNSDSSVDDLVGSSDFSHTTKGNTDIRTRKGGKEAMDKDFSGLGLSGVAEYPTGAKVGTTDGGRRVIARGSSDGRPTIEIQRSDGRKVAEIRYDK